MRAPIRFTLFDEAGIKVLSESDGYHGTIDELWRRSARGMSLVIRDGDGKTASVELIVALVQ
jgi:hypothetical protein